MANLIVNPVDRLSGVVKAPPSKSYTIRAVIAGLLADGESVIHDPLFSEDTRACMQVCSQVGASVEKGEDSIKVAGVGGRIQKPAGVLDTLNSGTTIRLMTAVSSLSDQEITLTGDESIQKRPIQPLLDALKQVDVKVESSNGCPPVKVKGSLAGGVCKIRGDISSQFISGLLMALPCAGKDSVVDVTTELKSRPYVDLTLDILNRFGVRVRNQDYKKFFVPGKQTYKATDYTVEGDCSSAAFLLGAAALTESEVTVKNIFRDSKQADKKIIEILQDMGADIKVGDDCVTVKGTGKLAGVKVDLSNSPDLVPIMTTLGSLAEGETVLYNVEHARIKECDRINAMATELKKMGADIEERQDGLVIQGKEQLNGAVVDGHRDHRVVMSLSIAGMKAEGETVITDGEYVSVTFPNYLELMTGLGAKLYLKE